MFKTFYVFKWIITINYLCYLFFYSSTTHHSFYSLYYSILGDAIAHTAGVSSEPEYFDYEFSKGREDLILVMASDGLWEFMSDQEVMDIASNTTEPRFAVDRLISESNERWMKEEQVIDDTTVCVAFLGSFQMGTGGK